MTPGTEYVSPFQLPDLGEKNCTRPEDQELYPDMHAKNRGNSLWGPECPVHGPKARVLRRSPWAEWYSARRLTPRLRPARKATGNEPWPCSGC